MRVVICSYPYSGGLFELAASIVNDERPFIGGGERSLYELAVALACLDIDVELRGMISQPILRRLTSAAGATPRVNLPPRRPDPDDVVVITEAPSLDLVTALALSKSRLVMYLLAPPGLIGWSFAARWQQPDLLVVPVDAVGLPPAFRAISDFGFTLWTNAHGIAAAGQQAGVPVEWLGTGTPVPFPEPRTKAVDVAIVENDQFAPLAERITNGLNGATVHRVPPTPSVYSLSEALAPARVLIWPARIEGMSRVQREARAVGTVPVALSTNPFATAEDHGEGIVLVDDLDALERETRALLADDERLTRLAAAGIESAARQTDWKSFVHRVGSAIDKVASAPPAGSDVMDALGEHSWTRVRSEADHHEAALREVASLRATCAALSEDLDRHRGWLKAIQNSWSWWLTAPLRGAKRSVRARSSRTR